MSYEEFRSELDKRVEDARFAEEETEIAKAYNLGLTTVQSYAKTIFLELMMKERAKNV